MGLTIVSLVLDAGVIATGMGVFPYFVAVQNGLASALCTCLLINGFVGFQLYEDGTSQSVWMIRGCSLIMFIISGAVSILTFMGKAGLGPENTIGLFVVLYILNALCVVVYIVMQVILVANTLQDRWPLGDIIFGVFFFVIGQLILYVFGEQICNGAQHYLDGLFFATICNLLAVMMVYKVFYLFQFHLFSSSPKRYVLIRLLTFAPQYWDSITREDLEFSVGTKQGNWEVKELLADDDRRTTIYQDNATDYTHSMHHQNSAFGDHRASVYGGGY